jgi:hypothetical protein
VSFSEQNNNMRKSSLIRVERIALTKRNKAERKERQRLGIKGSTLSTRKNKVEDTLWELGHTFDQQRECKNTQQPKHIFE